MIAAVGEIESSLKNNQTRIPSRGEKKKNVEMSAGANPW